MFEFDACIGGSELPADRCGAIIAPVGPARAELLENRTVGDAAVQALTIKGTHCNLGHVEPTAVLGCALQIQAVEYASRLFGAAQSLRAQADAPMMNDERAEHDAAQARLHAGLEPAALERTWGEGRTLSMEQAIALALSDDP